MALTPRRQTDCTWTSCRVRQGSGIDDGSPEGNSTWHLEDGVLLEFCQPGEPAFRCGDYWLIPARTATADVEWPGPAREPAQLAPRGVEHHYAPLGVLVTRDRRVTVEVDCLLTLEPLARPVSRRGDSRPGPGKRGVERSLIRNGFHWQRAPFASEEASLHGVSVIHSYILQLCWGRSAR